MVERCRGMGVQGKGVGGSIRGKDWSWCRDCVCLAHEIVVEFLYKKKVSRCVNLRVFEGGCV